MRTQLVRQCRLAFTLVELLVVISIVSVLLALVLPSMKNARQAALAARCGSQMRQVGTSFMRYAYDNKEWGPYRIYLNGSGLTGTWFSDYLPNTHVLRCPTDTVRPSTQGAIGGLTVLNGGQVVSSYFHLFGMGHYYGSTAPTSNYDNFHGWRILSGSYSPLPNLKYIGTTTTYVNKIGVVRTRTLLQASEQAIAADGFLLNATYFRGAVPLSYNYVADGLAHNTRNAMHPEYDGLNVQFADGHVEWRKSNEVISRFETGVAPTTTIWW